MNGYVVVMLMLMLMCYVDLYMFTLQQRLSDKVLSMRGLVNPDLSPDNTHLIANSVQSPKYQV